MMAIEYWYMLSYVVGTATGWLMFRTTRAEKEELIKSSCDQFMQLLIAGDCIRVKECEDGELEILTIQEAQELDADTAVADK